MALTDVFTGAQYKDANARTRAMLGDITSQGGAVAGRNLNAGLESLGTNAGLAAGAYGAGAAGGIGTLQGVTPQALDLLNRYTGMGVGAGQDYTDRALALLQGGVGAAQGAYAPVTAAGQGFLTRGNEYADQTAAALGLRGPEAAAAARTTFENTPGFRSALDLGQEGIIRAAAAGGMGASGNTFADVGKYTANAANQNYNNYLAALRGGEQLYAPLGASTLGAGATGFANAGLTGATGGANLLSGQGGRDLSAWLQAAGMAPGIVQDTGKGIAGLYSNLGTQQGNLWGNLGPQIANLFGQNTNANLGLLGQTINPLVQGNFQQAAGEQAGGLAGINLFGNLLTAAAGGGYLPGGTSFGPWAPKKG